MDFVKKLKIRLFVSYTYILIGVILIGLFYANIIRSEYTLSFSVVLIFMGLARSIRLKRIIKSEDSVHLQKIAETDERNISIILKAKSLAYDIYTVTLGVIVIILEVIGKIELATTIAFNVCILLILYLLINVIYRKKM